MTLRSKKSSVSGASSVPSTTPAFRKPKQISLLILSAVLAMATAACSSGSSMSSGNLAGSGAAVQPAGGGTSPSTPKTDGKTGDQGKTDTTKPAQAPSAVPFPANAELMSYPGNVVSPDSVACTSGKCPDNVVVDKTTTDDGGDSYDEDEGDEAQLSGVPAAYQKWTKAVQDSKATGKSALVFTSDIDVENGIQLEKPKDVTKALGPVVFTGQLTGGSLLVQPQQPVYVLGSKGSLEVGVRVSPGAQFGMTGVALYKVLNFGNFKVLPAVPKGAKISAEDFLSYANSVKAKTYEVKVDEQSYQFKDVGVIFSGKLDNGPQSVMDFSSGNVAAADRDVNLKGGYAVVPRVEPKANVKQILMFASQSDAGTAEGNTSSLIHGNFRNVVVPFDDNDASLGYLGVLQPAPEKVSLKINNDNVDALAYPLVSYKDSSYASVNDDDFKPLYFATDCDSCLDNESGNFSNETFTTLKQTAEENAEKEKAKAEQPSSSDASTNESDAGQPNVSIDDGGYDDGDDDESSVPTIYVGEQALYQVSDMTYAGPSEGSVIPVVFAYGALENPVQGSGTLTLETGGVAGVYGTQLPMSINVKDAQSGFYLSGSVMGINNNGFVQVVSGPGIDAKADFLAYSKDPAGDQSKVPVQLISKGIGNKDIPQIVAYPVGGVVDGDYTQGESGSLVLKNGILAVTGKATLAGSLEVSYKVNAKSYYALAVLSKGAMKGTFSKIMVAMPNGGKPLDVANDAQSIVRLQDAHGKSYAALVVKMPAASVSAEPAAASATASPRAAQPVAASGDRLGTLRQAAAKAETVQLSGRDAQGERLNFSARQKGGLSEMVSLLENDNAPAAVQGLKQVIDGTVFSRTNDMNANMEAFVLSQGQAALLKPQAQRVQVRLDASLFFGNDNHKANLQQVSVVGKLGQLRARAAVNRIGNSYTFNADEVVKGADKKAAGLKSESTQYGVNGGVAYTLPEQGVVVGAQLAYEYVSNKVAKDQLAKLDDRIADDLSYSQSVVQLDLLVSKAFQLAYQGVGQVQVSPFAGYRYGYEHQGELSQNFKVGTGEVAFKVPALSRQRNSLLLGVQANLGNAFDVKGLGLGAALTAQYRFNSEKAVQSTLTLQSEQLASATLNYKEESRFNLQGHFEASYQFDRFNVGASLDALYHADGEPVLLQVGLNAAVNF